MPLLVEYIASPEWSTKKVAIDCIYSIAAIDPDEVIPFKLELLKVLQHCRFDKIKPVREATVEAVKLLKEIGPYIDESEYVED